jgi:hypothetical protein
MAKGPRAAPPFRETRAPGGSGGVDTAGGAAHPTKMKHSLLQSEGWGLALRARDLELKELIARGGEGGVIRFAGHRALRLDAVAMGVQCSQGTHRPAAQSVPAATGTGPSN